jgi:hypothetical protein
MNLLPCLALAVSFTGMIRANEMPCSEDGPDLDEIEYIEEDEADFNLGFDPSDYLPESFDPYIFYMDLAAIEYLIDDPLDFEPAACLPAHFNPYAFPANFRHISYMDPSDDLKPEGDYRKHLPEGFNPYIILE